MIAYESHKTFLFLGLECQWSHIWSAAPLQNVGTAVENGAFVALSSKVSTENVVLRTVSCLPTC